MPDVLETLAELVQLHANGHDLPRHVPHLRLADAIARGGDPLHLLRYLAEQGVQIATLEDVFAACTDPGEGELQAFRVEEGVAVFQTIDGAWLLFTR